MIGRRHRFHGYGSVRAVYPRSQTLHGPSISLRFASRGASHKTYRVAVVVSRKVSTSAVVRNRIRRRIYEIVRRHEELVPAATDLVFSAFNQQVAEMDAAQLDKTVTALLKKTHAAGQ